MLVPLFAAGEDNEIVPFRLGPADAAAHSLFHVSLSPVVRMYRNGADPGTFELPPADGHRNREQPRHAANPFAPCPVFGDQQVLGRPLGVVLIYFRQ